MYESSSRDAEPVGQRTAANPGNSVWIYEACGSIAGKLISVTKIVELYALFLAHTKLIM